MANFEKTLALWLFLAQWHGFVTADLVSDANYLVDDEQGFDESALWDADPDFALEVSDLLDVASLLALGGCLDAP